MRLKYFKKLINKKMVKLTFSFSDQAGDIPTYKFTRQEVEDDFFTFISDQLDLCDDKVFVAFQSFKDCNYKDKHKDFFITDDSAEAELNFYNIFDKNKDDIEFNFFCFKTYKEAFKYCIDLKEGL